MNIQGAPEKTDVFQRRTFHILLNLQYYVSVYIICILCYYFAAKISLLSNSVAMTTQINKYG